jgi:predicted kinase
LLRGAPGCGKSTFVKETGLGPYTVSSDSVRLLFGSPELGPDGGYAIPHSSEVAVWGCVRSAVEARMKKGDLTVVDATHYKLSSLSDYKKLAETFGYSSYLVNFSHVPVETCIGRDGGREVFRRVGEARIREMHARILEDDDKIPSWLTSIRPEDFAGVVAADFEDYSNFEKIHHIGDLQGCSTVLEKYLAGGVDPSHLYIFVGDFLDRGIENAKVFRLVQGLSKMPNVILVEGNHERHIRSWSRGEVAGSRVFNEGTLPDLLAAGITQGDAKEVIGRLRPYVLYRYRGKKVVVSHAGLPVFPKVSEINFIPAKNMISGVGSYEYQVDEVFSKNTADDEFQVHGHRNVKCLPTEASPRSFNLEGRVEFGGFLRAVVLDCEGFRPVEIKNDLFDQGLSKSVEVWDGDEQGRREAKPTRQPLSVEGLVEALRNSPMVKEKDLGDGISSFNFTRDAFFGKVWNDQTVRARGLFINVATNEIVARSYDKFFNLGEMPETSIDGLKSGLSFPLKVYLKENGYLGIVGYDRSSKKVIFASKTTTNGDFAERFKDIATSVMGVGEVAFKRFVSRGLSLVFEVVDPIHDPHIIKYEDRKIVLLDAVKNKIEFGRVDHKNLLAIGDALGVGVKKEHAELGTFEELTSFLRSCNEGGEFVDGREVEGFVVEDSKGFMFKIKLPFYNLWKANRRVCEMMRRDVAKGVGKDLSIRWSDKVGEDSRPFYEWLLRQPQEIWEKDIIFLRERFLKDLGKVE